MSHAKISQSFAIFNSGIYSMGRDELIKRIFYIDYREAWVLKKEIVRFTDDERSCAEEVLLKMVGDSKLGFLVMEALSELRSNKAIPIMYENLADEKLDEVSKLMLASCIYKINKDSGLIVKGISLFRALKNKFSVIHSMYYLAQMNCAETRQVIEEYVGHTEYLVSYNAKRFLEIMMADQRTNSQ